MGCNPQRINFKGRTSLHLAAERGELPCIEALIEAGADCDFQDPVGETQSKIGTWEFWNNTIVVLLLTNES